MYSSMIINPQEVFDTYLTSCQHTKVSQNGIDCSLQEELVLAHGTHKNILLNEKIELPENLCAELKIRSTYSRKGIFLSSGLWDSGFKGHLGCTLYNLSGMLITIPLGERICQLVCYEADSASMYNGQWQGI